MTAEHNSKKATTVSLQYGGTVSNAGGKVLHEEQTNVSRDGWQELFPSGTCPLVLPSRGESISPSPNLSWPVTCFDQWNAAEVTACSRSSLKPSSFCFALLEGSSRAVEKFWLDCYVREATSRGRPRGGAPTKLSAECSHVSEAE